jgi:hypothetical protein
MIITVLWEDSRGEVAKGFGPHELLVACLDDDLAIGRNRLNDLVKPIPKNGNANVRKALKQDIERLRKAGPVVVVVDWDAIGDLWKYANPRPPACKAGISSCFRQDAPGDYDLVFLEQNIETLVKVACEATAQAGPPPKQPDARDGALGRAAWAPENVRQAIREGCPTFDRIVARVAGHVPPKLRPA